MNAELLEAAEAHRPALLALGMRMLGAPQAAEDLAQDTLLRLAERPPCDLESPLRPWLLRVAGNLAKDRLRARKLHYGKRAFVPAPLPLPDPEDALETRQSATLAWLLAAEALTPQQRLVWVLREVLECSAVEVAGWTDSTPGAVRGTLHRARKALQEQPVPTLDGAGQRQHQMALLAFGAALQSGDLEAAAALLAPGVRFHSDGGGVYPAAGMPLEGAKRVLAAIKGLSGRGGDLQFQVVWAGVTPAVLLSFPSPLPRHAPRALWSLVLDPQGRIAAFTALLDPARIDACLGAATPGDPSSSR